MRCAFSVSLDEPASGRYLFPSAEGKSHRVTIRKPWMQVLRAAGLAEGTQVPSKRNGMMKPSGSRWSGFTISDTHSHRFWSRVGTRLSLSANFSDILAPKPLSDMHTIPTGRWATVASSFPQLSARVN